MTDQGGLADPFFEALRERHPDIDIVMLAPSPEPAPVEDPVDAGDAREMAGSVREAFESLRPVLRDGESLEPVHSWRPAPTGGWSFTSRVALRGVGDESGREQLRRIASALHERGWAVRAKDSGTLVVLQCTNGWMDVEARTGAAATTVVAASPPVAIRDTDLEELRTETRAR